MIAKGQDFSDVTVILDGSSFYNCTFTRCTIVFSGQLPFMLQDPKFIDCKWEVVGPADQTMKYLASLYRAGAKDLVESTFNMIRGQQAKAPAN